MSSKQSSDFSYKLINWYNNHKRDLPWRHTTNPYFIWLSEIILQQTQIAQGLPYYLKFVQSFPTVQDLANASEDQVLKLWQGLGYYSRARNLHHTAQLVAFELNGQFPDNFNDLKKLKGVGNYTAAAIASFCYKESVAVVDGNVYRVLARYFGDQTNIASSQSYNHFFQLAMSLIDHKSPDAFNQALMEFGSQHCTVHQPQCDSCIFKTSCWANAHHKQKELPVKINTIKIKTRYLLYLVLLDAEKKVYVQKRSSKEIWGGLYEFMLLETQTQPNENELKNLIKNYAWAPQIESINWIAETFQHQLTHQKLYVSFVKIALNSEENTNFISLLQLKKLPVPVVIEKFIKQYLS